MLLLKHLTEDYPSPPPSLLLSFPSTSFLSTRILKDDRPYGTSVHTVIDYARSEERAHLRYVIPSFRFSADEGEIKEFLGVLQRMGLITSDGYFFYSDNHRSANRSGIDTIAVLLLLHNLGKINLKNWVVPPGTIRNFPPSSDLEVRISEAVVGYLDYRDMRLEIELEGGEKFILGED